MAYAIGNIVFGIHLNGNETLLEAVLEQDRIDQDDEYSADPAEVWEIAEGYGFDHDYSGNGEAPYWVGVRIGRIDECGPIRFSDLPQVSVDQKLEAREMIAKLPELIRNAVKESDIDTWILWGSS